MKRFINEKIGAWLIEQGNSRKELAEALGMSRPTLNGRLDGATKWSWEEVVKLSGIIGCSLDELAGITPAA